jgi:hypothetical protein
MNKSYKNDPYLTWVRSNQCFEKFPFLAVIPRSMYYLDAKSTTSVVSRSFWNSRIINCMIYIYIYQHRNFFGHILGQPTESTILKCWNNEMLVPYWSILVPRAFRPRTSSLGPGTHGTGSARKLAVVFKEHALELGHFSPHNNFHSVKAIFH